LAKTSAISAAVVWVMPLRKRPLAPARRGAFQTREGASLRTWSYGFTLIQIHRIFALQSSARG